MRSALEAVAVAAGRYECRGELVMFVPRGSWNDGTMDDRRHRLAISSSADFHLARTMFRYGKCTTLLWTF